MLLPYLYPNHILFTIHVLGGPTDGLWRKHHCQVYRVYPWYIALESSLLRLPISLHWHYWHWRNNYIKQRPPPDEWVSIIYHLTLSPSLTTVVYRRSDRRGVAQANSLSKKICRGQIIIAQSKANCLSCTAPVVPPLVYRRQYIVAVIVPLWSVHSCVCVCVCECACACVRAF